MKDWEKGKLKCEGKEEEKRAARIFKGWGEGIWIEYTLRTGVR